MQKNPGLGGGVGGGGGCSGFGWRACEGAQGGCEQGAEVGGWV